MYYTSKESIEDLFQHFKGKFSTVSDDILHKRISNHYEGGLFDIWTKEDWYNVLNYTNHGQLLTLFKNWDEYIKYDGDYKKHPFFSKKNWHLI